MFYEGQVKQVLITSKDIINARFRDYFSLRKVIFDGDIDIIPDEFFSGCWSLEEITIPYGVKEIGEQAFLDCSSLRSVYIPNTVKKIAKSAFFGCTALSTIQISDNMIVVPNEADSEEFIEINLPTKGMTILLSPY